MPLKFTYNFLFEIISANRTEQNRTEQNRTEQIHSKPSILYKLKNSKSLNLFITVKQITCISINRIYQSVKQKFPLCFFLISSIYFTTDLVAVFTVISSENSFYITVSYKFNNFLHTSTSFF